MLAGTIQVMLAGVIAVLFVEEKRL